MGKEPELVCEMGGSGLDIVHLTSLHSKGSGTKPLNWGWSLSYSGGPTGDSPHAGVGILTSPRLRASINGWLPCSYWEWWRYLEEYNWEEWPPRSEPVWWNGIRLLWKSIMNCQLTEQNTASKCAWYQFTLGHWVCDWIIRLETIYFGQSVKKGGGRQSCQLIAGWWPVGCIARGARQIYLVNPGELSGLPGSIWQKLLCQLHGRWAGNEDTGGSRVQTNLGSLFSLQSNTFSCTVSFMKKYNRKSTTQLL